MKKVLSKLIFLLSIISLCSFYLKFGKDAPVLYGDALGYYNYLPSIFIYNNLDAPENLPSNKDIEKPIFDYLNSIHNEMGKSPIGKSVNQYTCGIAMLEFPFFCGAHLWEKLQHSTANGYSLVYINAVRLSTIFYLLIGLLLVYYILQYYVSKDFNFIALSLLIIATNIFWFSSCQFGMAHIPLFTLYAALLFLTIKLFQKPKTKLFLLMGICVGMIVLIRPTDIVCIFIPLLFGVYNRFTFLKRIAFCKAYKFQILIAMIAFLIPIIPQLIYWKHNGGSWIYYSYGSQSFNFTAFSQIKKGLFFASNGWLVYTPMMILFPIGFYFFKKIRNIAYSIIIIFPIYVYVIYSWWCYNYINGIGSRPMIHLYPLLIIPIIVLIEQVFVKYKKLIIPLILFLLFCVFENIQLSIQTAKHYLWPEFTSYRAIINRLTHNTLSYEDLFIADDLYIQPKDNSITDCKILNEINFENNTNGDTLGVIDYGQEYSNFNISTPYNSAQMPNAKWIKASGRFYINDVQWSLYWNTIFVFELKSASKSKIWKAARINNKIGFENGKCKYCDEFDLWHYHRKTWDDVTFYIPIDNRFVEQDSLKLSIINIMKCNKILVKNLQISICK